MNKIERLQEQRRKMSRSVNAKRLGNGVYEYQGYKLANCGHYMSDNIRFISRK